MGRSLVRRAFAPVVELRDEESVTALLMFCYSFLVMTGYNLAKPVTYSKFIEGLGADNQPYVVIVASLIIGGLMQGYTRVMAALPRRWAIPIAQVALAGVLAAFWVLFKTGQDWVAAAFFLFRLMLAVLLISQFFTLANVIYDPRQAKRLFGFIYAGAPLGGLLGSSIVAFFTREIGTTNLLLVGTGFLLAGIVITLAVVIRERAAGEVTVAVEEEKGVGGREAIRLLRESKHLQIIAVIIGFAAAGASIIELQLSLAAQAFKGQTATDALTTFFGQIQLWTSAIAFVVQIALTSRIHRFLGIGFALLILPVSLGASAVVMLLNRALWAPSLARISDQSLRYTIDKTTREILFLPLPTELKYRAKPLTDVTVDRLGKGIGMLIALALIKPWGLGLDWQQVSYASLGITGLWIGAAFISKRGYVKAFRTSIEQRVVEPGEVRTAAADLSTIETLIGELSHTDAQRVIYAIDMLESLDKRHLVSPLLLYHESPQVRIRALGALSAARSDLGERWSQIVERLLTDENTDVRAAAVQALSAIRHLHAAELLRPYLADSDPRIVAIAAVALARGNQEEDIELADRALTRLAGDASVAARREAATASGQLVAPRFQALLIPLLHDPETSVAEEAMRSVRRLETANFIFVPTLISLLRHRRLKSEARNVLVSYGEQVLDTLAYFLRDPDEDIWVRRHLPTTIARIPSQRAMDILIDAFSDDDGFIRFKTIVALEKLHRDHPELTFQRKAVETLVLREARRHHQCLSWHYNLFGLERMDRDFTNGPVLLDRALSEKLRRARDRVFRLLAMLHPWKDVAAARWALEHGDVRTRSSAAEYLDNLLDGTVRKQVMPIVEDLPVAERVRRANVLLRTRQRDVEETLLQLINDEDQIVSSAAIGHVAELKVWSLKDDLEHVLAHRDVKDFYVFEAASWALAASRMTEERRRRLWLEPLPAMELATRLHNLPMFRSVSVDELFRLASTGRQVRYGPGRVLCQCGVVPDTMQFLLDGRVALADGEATPPAALGFEEVLQGVPLRETVETAETCVCLSLTRAEFETLLADNTDLIQGFFRTMSAHAAHAPPVLPGLGTSAVEKLPVGALRPVDRALVLQGSGLFAALNGDEALRLASIARESRLSADTVLFSSADVPPIYSLIRGELLLEHEGLPPQTAQPGNTIGLFQSLAGVPTGTTAVARREAWVLRLDRDDLFELLAQHPSLLQHLVAAALQGQRANAAGVS